jgi:dTDP-4-amino-4,6-dideoxygalactose transaminase
MRLDDPNSRESILATMRQAGVQGDTVLNYVVPGLDCYRAEKFSADPFPNAGAWSRSVINLPNHPTMSDTQVYHVVDTIKRAMKGYHGK